MNPIKPLFSATLLAICLAGTGCRTVRQPQHAKALAFETYSIAGLYTHAAHGILSPREEQIFFAEVNNDPPNAPQLWKIDLGAEQTPKHPHQAMLELHNNPLGIADTLFIRFENDRGDLETHYFVSADCGYGRQTKKRCVTSRDIVYHPTDDADHVGRPARGIPFKP